MHVKTSRRHALRFGTLPATFYISLTLVALEPAASALLAEPPTIQVPDGFRVELAASAPLVQHPMMGCFDERGRLFLAESAGRNLNEVQLDRLRPNSVRMLEDVDGDGVFDRSTTFADKLAIPNGALWLNGSLYVAEPPGIWRFTDTDDDGVADLREHIAGNVRSNGMSSTLHGPALHPSGRIFWCGGQMGYAIDRDGAIPEGRIAPGVFSLLPDGSEHEVYAVGGRANPVEVAFGAAGDVFGTVAILDVVDGARHDALMHWVYGGLYSCRDRVPEKINRTGPFLPPLSHVGQVAPAGIARYQSAQFGPEFKDNLFWTQFNTHKLIRTSLARDGATFSATDQDFAICESVDFHPTDVIEDADGSLLLIDTGGWFRHGCPTSRIAHPEALGAIYRIRSTSTQPVADPRGKKIEWESASVERLIELLGDARPAVVDRAIATLAYHREDAMDALEDALFTATNSTVRLNCIWSLSRRGTATALEAIMVALDDKASDVQQAAANALGMARYDRAIKPLSNLVASRGDPIVRREAAAALARIGAIEDVAPLLHALRDSTDPFFQHALIDALIRANQTKPLVQALTVNSTAVRRGALLALSQLADATIAPEAIQSMLIDRDIALREAAFEIAREDPRLRDLLPDAVRSILADEALVHDIEQRAAILNALLSLDHLPSIQQAIAETSSPPMRDGAELSLLLEVMRRTDIPEFPQVWIPIVESTLIAPDPRLRESALEVIAAQRIPRFDALLITAASNNQLPQSFRTKCLETVAPRLDTVPDQLFELAISQLNTNAEPLDRALAARALSEMALSFGQLRVIAEHVATADALVIPSLLNCFTRSTDAATGELLVDAIQKRPNFNALPPERLSGIFRRFPATTQQQATPILNRLGADLNEQERRMTELMSLTKGGNVLRGKEVFFGKKASCSACHRVKGQGELVGPDLTAIASIRAPRDLLESIIFPSASIVQDYQPLLVLTTEGQVVTGLVMRKSDKELTLKGSDLKEIRIRMEEVDEMREATVSIMPQGLEEKLSQNELQDLLAFLLDLKPKPSYLLDD